MGFLVIPVWFDMDTTLVKGLFCIIGKLSTHSQSRRLVFTVLLSVKFTEAV